MASETRVSKESITLSDNLQYDFYKVLYRPCHDPSLEDFEQVAEQVRSGITSQLEGESFNYVAIKVTGLPADKMRGLGNQINRLKYKKEDGQKFVVEHRSEPQVVELQDGPILVLYLGDQDVNEKVETIKAYLERNLRHFK